MDKIPEELRDSLLALGYNQLSDDVYEMKKWRVVWNKDKLYVPYNIPGSYIHDIIKQFGDVISYVRLFNMPGGNVFALHYDACSADSIEYILDQSGFSILERIDNESGTWFYCMWAGIPVVIYYVEDADKIICVTDELQPEYYETLTSIFPDIILTSPQTIFGVDFNGNEYATCH